MPEHPYQHDDGRPRLRNSWVLYLDALGTTERSARLTEPDLHDRVKPEGWYHRFLYHGNAARHQRVLYFTDNAVVGIPADEQADLDPLRSLEHLLLGTSTYVVGMAISAGIAYRGGVVFGPAYVDDRVLRDDLAAVRMAHGSAVVEAVKLEKRAKNPRIVLDKSVLDEVQRLTNPSNAQSGITGVSVDLLTEGTDAVVILDHLGQELSAEPNLSVGNPEHPHSGSSRAELLEGYAQFIRDGLLMREEVSSKYVWLAAYYNYVVKTRGVGSPLSPAEERFSPFHLT